MKGLEFTLPRLKRLSFCCYKIQETFLSSRLTDAAASGVVEIGLVLREEGLGDTWMLQLHLLRIDSAIARQT